MNDTNYISWVYKAMNFAFESLSTLWGEFGLSLVTFVVGIVTISAIYKYVLSPYLSGSGSDKARKKGGKGK